MEGDSSVTSTGLEWQNLALYTAKPPPMQIFEGSSSSSRDFAYEDMIMRTMQCSSPPDPVVVGLRLGAASTRGLAPSSSSSSIPVSSTPTKRSRASYHNMQNPCCQVQGCNLDLRSAKDYHRRHRICESHSKSPKVIVAGMERRFCQQCSRFHDLSEFDDKKRSCRRRLSDHNARRRRVQPESIQLSSPGISPALYTDQRQQHNVLLNGLPVSMSNSSWENTSPLLLHHALARPSKTLNDDVLIMDPERLASIHRSTPRILDQCLQHGPSTNSSMAADLLSAHSLLSSNSWSLNEGEESAASMEGMGNYSSPVMRHSEFQTNNNINGLGLELDHFVQSANLHDAAASSHHQEYHLFKPPNFHSGNFYSTQRSL